VFFPGAAGVQFLNQYVQAGIKQQIPLYTDGTIDELSLPLQKENALGILGVQEWVNDLPNEENKRFVADYRKKYPGLRPRFYGAQAYDAVLLINSAVVAVKGDLTKKDAMKAEMERANFKSLRGRFNTATTTSRSRVFLFTGRGRRPTARSPSRRSPPSLRTIRIASTTNAR
jgi:branched-chain amino acid transport system substrate-binding protein